MLTIDVKHPDVEHFLKAKKVPNWVTNQIVDQCNWSGLFEKNELEIIKKQVMENTQVRFANISIKASDEFMQAVDEQCQFHKGEFLIYKKKKGNNLLNAHQDFENIHYSINIPSKNIQDYPTNNQKEISMIRMCSRKEDIKKALEFGEKLKKYTKINVSFNVFNATNNSTKELINT